MGERMRRGHSCAQRSAQARSRVRVLRVSIKIYYVAVSSALGMKKILYSSVGQSVRLLTARSTVRSRMEKNQKKKKNFPLPYSLPLLSSFPLSLFISPSLSSSPLSLFISPSLLPSPSSLFTSSPFLFSLIPLHFPLTSPISLFPFPFLSFPLFCHGAYHNCTCYSYRP